MDAKRSGSYPTRRSLETFPGITMHCIAMPAPAALIKYFLDLRNGYKDAECKILKERLSLYKYQEIPEVQIDAWSSPSDWMIFTKKRFDWPRVPSS